MKKLFWVLIIIIALLLCFFIAKLTVFYDEDQKSSIEMPIAAETSSDAPISSPVSEITTEATEAVIATATPKPLTDEEYDEMIQQEIEELQQEDPLINEEGEEVPTMDISGEEEIIIEDTEGAGSL